MAEDFGPATNVLAIVDGSDDHRKAATASAGLLAATPGLRFTVMAPSNVAQPSGAPRPQTNGNGLLLQREQATSGLLETVRDIEDRGLPTKLRTVEGPLLDEAIANAHAHDLVVLPPSLAEHAPRFPVPTLVAP